MLNVCRIVDHPYAGWPLIVILFSVQLTIGDCFQSFSRTMQLTLQRKRQTLAKNWPQMAKRLKARSSAKVQKCWHLRPVWSALPICEAPHLCSKPATRCAEPFLSPPFVLTILNIYSKMDFPNSIQISQMICFSRVGLSGTLINLTHHLVTEPRPALKRSPVVER